jgi:putative FmdB family regulatory protein
MPIYEYKCMNCGHAFEQIRPMCEADKAIECEKCKSRETTRQLSVFNSSSGGKALAGGHSGCGNCGGGHCSSCSH